MNQPINPQQPPVSFLALPSEIRHLIYIHLFPSVTIYIGSHDQLDNRGLLSDDFWGPVPDSSAPDFHISPSEGFDEYEDRYDSYLGRRRPFSERCAKDVSSLITRGREHGWRNYDRGSCCSGCWQPIRQALSFQEDCGVLEKCRQVQDGGGLLTVSRQVRKDAPSAIGTNMKVIVLDANFQIEDLPLSFRQYCLPQIQNMTFAGNDSEVERARSSRGEETFDVRYSTLR